MIRYQEFYKKRGVKSAAFFSTPPVSTNKFLALPQGSVYHYTDHGIERFGEDDPIIEQLLGKTCVQNVYGLSPTAIYGKRHRLQFNMTSTDQHFFHEHKQYLKYAQAEHTLPKSPNTLHIVNYMHIEAGIDYQTENLRDYHAYLNRNISIFDHVAKSIKHDNRMHFLRIKIPLHIPPMSLMNKCTPMFPLNHTLWEEMPEPEQLILLEFWKWLDVGKEHGDHPSFLDKVDTADLDRLCVIFVVGGHWAMYNLGLVRTWIKTKDNPRGKYAADQIRRKFLGLLINMSHLRMQVSHTTDTPEDGNHGLVDALVKQTEAIGNEEDHHETGFVLKTPDQSQPQHLGVGGSTLGAVEPKKFSFYQQQRPQLSSGISIAETKLPTTGKEEDDEDDESAEVDQALEDAQLQESLDELELIHKKTMAERLVVATDYKVHAPVALTHESAIGNLAESYASKGLLSASQVKRFKTLSGRYKTIKAFKGDMTVEQAIHIPPESLHIEEVVRAVPKKLGGVLDESMYNSTLVKSDKQYINETMHRDVYAAIMHFQKAGIVVKDIRVEHKDDLLNDHHVYKISLAPLVGVENTISLKVPNVAHDGSFKSAGTEYRMRKQHTDVAVRKTSHREVAMTSDMTKVFVSRSDQVVADYSSWLAKQVRALAIQDNPTVKDVHFGSVFNQYIKVPRAYSAMSMHFSEFRVGSIHFNWDLSKNAELYPGVKHLKEHDVPCGFNSHGTVVMNEHGFLHVVTETGGFEPLGSFETILGLTEGSGPEDVITMEIYRKNIPLGMILGYYMGLGNLIATLSTKVRRLPKGARMDLEPWEFAVRFSDETLIVDKHDYVASMLLNGFNRFAGAIKEHSIYSFDNKDTYKAVWFTKDIVTSHVLELDLMLDMWIDPATHDQLVELKMPTDYIQLLLYVANMLVDDRHPDEMDEEFMRIRGYDRISGMVYNEVVSTIRTFRRKPLNQKQSVSMHPEVIWYNIIQDETVMPIDRSNPVQAMKDQEVVVFSGKGGRSSRTLMGATRKLHLNSVGVISEATVDNGETGAIVYMSANPNLSSVRGTTRRLDRSKKTEPARIISPSFLLCPGAEYDDAKRVNFINIQNSQTIHANGYHHMPCRTGYDKIVPYRAGNLFAVMAKEDGVVTDVGPHAITVKYKDGTTETAELGRIHGKWSGAVIPHNLVTDLKEGSKITQGEPIAYNTLYMKRDPMNRGEIGMVWGVLARTVLWEAKETLEDSSGVSKEFANKLHTPMTHLRYVSVDPDTEVLNLVKVGKEVLSDDILCTLAPPTVASSTLFNDASLASLHKVASSNPVVKHHGVIEKYEVYYTGEIDTMTRTVADLVKESDHSLNKRRKALGLKPATFKVPIGHRIDGKPMGPNQAVVVAHITGDTGYADGDKFAVAGQLKSITGRVFVEPPVTEDGKPVDISFGQRSVDARIVGSVYLIGTTNTISIELGRLFVEDYQS